MYSAKNIMCNHRYAGALYKNNLVLLLINSATFSWSIVSSLNSQKKKDLTALCQVTLEDYHSPTLASKAVTNHKLNMQFTTVATPM